MGKTEDEGIAVIVEGEKLQTAEDNYQGPSFPPKPAERLSTHIAEPLSMSASELDKKLRENLEYKAIQWYGDYKDDIIIMVCF